MEVGYTAGEEVLAAIARAGRTEDVQFSPAGDRLAVAGFNDNRLLILGIETNWKDGAATVELTRALEVESDALQLPHGISWIDEQTLAVANRRGRLVIFELPEQPNEGRINLPPLRRYGDESADLLKTPGSVSARPVGLDLLELLACNNYVQYVSRHLIDRRDGYALLDSDILIHDGIDVPDGVTQSPSGEWIAVSNHGHHCVFLFRYDRQLGPHSQPHGVLRGINYPHGVRFADHGRSILVADAGAPFVRLFRSDGDWSGERQPDESIRVISDESFKRGSNRPDEGGPKGIDVTRDGTLMVTSCEEVPFAFFDMRQILSQSDRDQIAAANAESAREALLRYIAADRTTLHEATDAVRRAGELEMGLIMSSRSWRVTAPLRWTMSTLRRKVPRRRERSKQSAMPAEKDLVQ